MKGNSDPTKFVETQTWQTTFASTHLLNLLSDLSVSVGLIFSKSSCQPSDFQLIRMFCCRGIITCLNLMRHHLRCYVFPISCILFMKFAITKTIDNEIPVRKLVMTKGQKRFRDITGGAVWLWNHTFSWEIHNETWSGRWQLRSDQDFSKSKHLKHIYIIKLHFESLMSQRLVKCLQTWNVNTLFLWQLNYLKFDKFPQQQQSIAKSEVEKLQTARLLCSVFLKSVHALLLQTRFGNGEIIGLQIITSLVIVFVSQIWPRIVASN